MMEKVHSVLRAQGQLQLLPELGQNLRPNKKKLKLPTMYVLFICCAHAQSVNLIPCNNI